MHDSTTPWNSWSLYSLAQGLLLELYLSRHSAPFRAEKSPETDALGPVALTSGFHNEPHH